MTLHGPLRTLSIVLPFGSLSKTLEQPYRPRVFVYISQISNEAHSTKKHEYWWWIRQCQVLKTLSKFSVFVKTTQILYNVIRPMSDFGKRKKQTFMHTQWKRWSRNGLWLTVTIILNNFLYEKKMWSCNFFSIKNTC